MGTTGMPGRAGLRPLAFSCGVLLLLHVPFRAYAVCRVVEPLGESGGIVFDPNTLVLFVHAPDQLVGSTCVPVGNGPDDDMDAGTEGGGGAGSGAGSECPAGTRPNDRVGSIMHMVVQPAVLSTGRAGLVMPVPARPDVHAANPDLFTGLRERLQPRIMENRIQVEDASLGYQCRDPKWSSDDGGGCGGGGDDYRVGDAGDRRNDFFDPIEDDPLQRVMFGDDEVSFAKALSTRDYDVTVLSASSPDALVAWLDENGFAHDADDDEAFAAYVNEGSWFVALDVHPRGFRELDPLVVSWAGDTIPLMHRLQYDPDGGELTSSVFVMAPSRVDALDGSARTLYAAPAGFAGELRGFGLATGWITQLELTRETSQRLRDSQLIPVPSLELRPVLPKDVKVRIPSSQCPDDDGDGGWGCGCRTRSSGGDRLASSLLPSALVLIWLARRRRRGSR